MKNSILYLSIITLILLSACTNEKSKIVSEPGATEISSDLENISWMNQYTLVKEVAHSGRFSSKVDSINRFSFGFSNTFMHISDTLPLSVDVSAWIYYSQKDINNSLVLSIDSSGNNIYYKGIPLTDSIKAINTWQQIKTTFELPKRILPSELLKIYVWNNDKNPFYVDDLKLIFRNR